MMKQPIDREEILMVLRQIHDPELEINIVDLGLIYGIRIEEGHVEVQMTMTSPGCPMHEIITSAAHYSLQAVKGVESVEIQLVWTPPWSTDLLSPEAKAQLG
jgi:metal-sulfur cluster biosynthetic enzyme